MSVDLAASSDGVELVGPDDGTTPNCNGVWKMGARRGLLIGGRWGDRVECLPEFL